MVIGSIWNSSGEPPIDQPLDAQFKRVLKTPGGLELVFDDVLKQIRLSHPVGHQITLSVNSITIELAEGAGKLTLSLPGQATLEAGRPRSKAPRPASWPTASTSPLPPPPSKPTRRSASAAAWSPSTEEPAMPLAARITDKTGHPGFIMPVSPL